MGNVNPPENLYALKYSRIMDHIAKAKYLKSFERNHENPSHGDCGLFICEESSFSFYFLFVRKAVFWYISRFIS